MNVDEAIKILIDAGFLNGWSLLGDVLTIWEHDTDPPLPFVRPELNKP